MLYCTLIPGLSAQNLMKGIIFKEFPGNRRGGSYIAFTLLSASFQWVRIKLEKVGCKMLLFEKLALLYHHITLSPSSSGKF